MPQFEYNGPTPNWRKKFTLDGNGNRLELYPDSVSDPFDYTRPGGQKVEGRTFEVGERFDAEVNPDPNYFTEVADNG